MIDLHVTADTDSDSVRGAVVEQSRLRADFAEGLRRTIRESASRLLEEKEIDDVTVSVDLELKDDRVPGAPRERIEARLDVEGEDSLLAAVEEAVGTPGRAQIADATEERLLEHLQDVGLIEVVETTVIVTPIQFR